VINTCGNDWQRRAVWRNATSHRLLNAAARVPRSTQKILDSMRQKSIPKAAVGQRSKSTILFSFVHSHRQTRINTVTGPSAGNTAANTTAVTVTWHLYYTGRRYCGLMPGRKILLKRPFPTFVAVDTVHDLFLYSTPRYHGLEATQRYIMYQS
jgi:hypothetical protein